MSMRVAVLGAGAWGTTVAHLLAGRAATTLWARDPDLAREVATAGANPRYLPGHRLHPALAATGDLHEAVAGADLVVVGVPSLGFRATLAQLGGAVPPGVPIVSLAKGLEQGTDLRMTQVVAEVLPGHPAGVLTGPNLAGEVLRGHAAASVLALPDPGLAPALQALFSSERFRVYTNDDVVGSELAGSLKNVVAIAAGMAAGLGTGDNTRAAVITRGLAEMTRLGVALGGQPLTFSGLAGVGDLVLTCTSAQSRNRHVGEQLGRGRPLAEVEAELPGVAEGVRAAPVAVSLGRHHGVEVPLAEQVDAVINHGVPAAEAERGLLGRRPRHELHGLPGQPEAGSLPGLPG